MQKSRFLLLFLVMASAALTFSCNQSSALLVSQNTPPSFEIRRGFGHEPRIFPIFIVYQLHPDNEKVGPLQEDETKNRVLWRVVSKGGAESEKLERIEYGRVPAGFVQEIPSDGPPEKLQENQMYEARGPLSLMGNAVVRFTIVAGKVVSHPLPN